MKTTTTQTTMLQYAARKGGISFDMNEMGKGNWKAIRAQLDTCHELLEMGLMRRTSTMGIVTYTVTSKFKGAQ